MPLVNSALAIKCVPKGNDKYDELHTLRETAKTNSKQLFDRNNDKMQQSYRNQNHYKTTQPWQTPTEKSPTPYD